MSSVMSVSTPSNSTADESKEPHDSPSDRVERLLQKYKVPGLTCLFVVAHIHSSYHLSQRGSSGGSTNVMVRMNEARES